MAAEGDPAINVLCDGSSAREPIWLLVQFGQQIQQQRAHG